MKTFLTMLLWGMCVLGIYAQDVIVHKDGKVVMGKVTEIDKENIHYKKAENPDGPTYKVPLSEVLSVRYENGTLDKFEAVKVNKEETKDEEVVVLEDLEVITGSVQQEDDKRHFQVQPEVRLRMDESLDEENKGGFGFEAVAGFRLTPNLVVGPGVGFLTHKYSERIVCEEYDQHYGGYKYHTEDVKRQISEVPLFVQARYSFNQKRFSPYVAGQLGYAFQGEADEIPDESDYVSCFVNGAVGASVKINYGYILLDFNFRIQKTNHFVRSAGNFFGATIGYVWSKN